MQCRGAKPNACEKQYDDLLVNASQLLKKVNSERSPLEARLLLGHVLNNSVENLIADDDQEVSDLSAMKFHSLIERRLRYEPMAYLLGKKEFFGLEFQVQPGVLIPRPETEGLVSHVLKWIQENSLQRGTIIDLGTGSGCIALSLANNLPAGVRILASIIHQKPWLWLARIRRTLVPTSSWIKGDILAGPSSELKEIQFDMIVSNPPYIPSKRIKTLQKDIQDFEPHEALNGGKEGLDFYRAILSHWLPHLKSPGLLALECEGNEQLRALQAILDSSVDLLLDSPYFLLKR